jgi:hypothetical protein
VARVAPALFILPLAIVTAACASPADEPERSARSTSALNPAQVGSSGQILIAGSSVEIDYDGEPRFLSIKTVFTSATAGMHPVKVEPLDDHGDAALWITDGAYGNLAISRPQGSRSASLDFEFAHGSGNTMIVIRDESLEPARFRVTLGTPANPPNPDPDEGDAPGGAAPNDLAGDRCDGVIAISSMKQMYDYQGQPVYGVSPKKGTLSASVAVVSESQVRVTTNATYSPARDLHNVASGSFVGSPTQMVWDIPVSRNQSGTLVGSGSVGSAQAHVAIGASALALSFSGKISQPWNGNTETLSVSAGGNISLSSCVQSAPVASSCCQVASAPGCDTPTVEQCVCAADSFCCNSSWDAVCVDEVDSLGCGNCP